MTSPLRDARIDQVSSVTHRRCRAIRAAPRLCRGSARRACPLNKVSSVKIDVSITGAIWYVKGQPDVLENIVMVADTQRERITTSFVGQDRTTIFEPDRVVVQRSDGTIVERSDDPEASFEGQTADTPWNAIHVAYFSGEALWTYLTTPFLYTQERFIKEEIASIESRRRDVAAAQRADSLPMR